MSDTEIGTGPWRGPAGAASLDDGAWHAEAWGAQGSGASLYLGKFAGTDIGRDEAKRAVERWLAAHEKRKERQR